MYGSIGPYAGVSRLSSVGKPCRRVQPKTLLPGNVNAVKEAVDFMIAASFVESGAHCVYVLDLMLLAAKDGWRASHERERALVRFRGTKIYLGRPVINYFDDELAKIRAIPEAERTRIE